jgi:hypothetical protein
VDEVGDLARDSARLLKTYLVEEVDQLRHLA